MHHLKMCSFDTIYNNSKILELTYVLDNPPPHPDEHVCRVYAIQNITDDIQSLVPEIQHLIPDVQ